MPRRKVFVWMLIVLVAALLAAVVPALRAHERKVHRDLLRSTTEVQPLIDRIGQFRGEHGRYPRDLDELIADPSARPAHGGAEDTGRYDFLGKWCWTYRPRGPDSPILFRHLWTHATLIYEFPPADGFYFPTGVDRGWTLRDEGSVSYLGPGPRTE
jgi:hypothetical protein